MKSLIGIFIFYLYVIAAPAQSIRFYSDQAWSSTYFSPLSIENEIKGYGILKSNFLYGDYSSYAFEILNSNFQTVRRADISVETGMRVRQCYFNGSVFVVTLENYSGIPVENRLYDLTGRLLSIQMVGRKGLISSSKIHAVPYKGFIVQAVSGADVPVLQLRNDTSKLVWTISPEAVQLKGGMGPREKISFHSVNDHHVVIRCEVPDLKGAQSERQAKYHYRLYDIQTGAKIKDLHKTYQDKIIVPYGVSFVENKIIVYGQFYPWAKNSLGFDGKNSLGMFIQEYDDNGNFLREVYQPWTDLSSFLKTGEIDSKNYSIWFHDLLSAPDGGYYLVGESYYYDKVSGIEDLVLMELDDEYAVQNAVKYPKHASKFPISVLSENNFTLGENLKEAGLFGYKDSAITNDKQALTVLYTVPTEVANKKTVKVAAVGYTRGKRELVETDIEFEKPPEKVRILPAKNGYAAVIEYHPSQYLGLLRFYKLDL